MDHAGITHDAEDLARYRAGLRPLKRMWHKAELTPAKTVVEQALDALQRTLYPKQRRVK